MRNVPIILSPLFAASHLLRERLLARAQFPLVHEPAMLQCRAPQRRVENRGRGLEDAKTRAPGAADGEAPGIEGPMLDEMDAASAPCRDLVEPELAELLLPEENNDGRAGRAMVAEPRRDLVAGLRRGRADACIRRRAGTI